MPRNDSIAPNTTLSVVFLGQPSLNALGDTRTFLLLTPDVLVQLCYFSTVELNALPNRIQVKLAREDILRLRDHYNTLVTVRMRFATFIPLLETVLHYINDVADKVINSELEYLYVTVPLLSTKTITHTGNVSIQNFILQYHQVIFGSLVFATCFNPLAPNRQDIHTPIPLTDCPALFLLPEYTLFINGIEHTPCALCRQNKDATKNATNCIFYTPGYECAFTSDLPIVSPQTQSNKLAAIMSTLDEDDLKLLDDVDSSEDALENAWLAANPEFAGGATNE